jgi:hypothetical protein
LAAIFKKKARSKAKLSESRKRKTAAVGAKGRRRVRPGAKRDVKKKKVKASAS